MKNKPEKIYLNLGTNGGVEDFKTLSEVTWCEDRVNDDDLEFISVSSILARIKELENLKFNTTEKSGVDNFNTNSSIINELKNLIK
jgi:aldehyde:ferredoxin oxidoreductase